MNICTYKQVNSFVANFILNFTTGALQRHLRSMKISKPFSYKATESLVDLSTETFQDIVMDNKKVKKPFLTH